MFWLVCSRTWCVWIQVHVYHSMWMEVRAQPSGGKPFLPSRVLGNKPRSSDLCSKLSYQLSHLVPHITVFHKKDLFLVMPFYLCACNRLAFSELLRHFMHSAIVLNNKCLKNISSRTTKKIFPLGCSLWCVCLVILNQGYNLGNKGHAIIYNMSSNTSNILRTSWDLRDTQGPPVPLTKYPHCFFIIVTKFGQSRFFPLAHMFSRPRNWVRVCSSHFAFHPSVQDHQAAIVGTHTELIITDKTSSAYCKGYELGLFSRQVSSWHQRVTQDWIY